jgi:polysaccharide chain length determinant protein (PEP-CTERM system associated)
MDAFYQQFLLFWHYVRLRRWTVLAVTAGLCATGWAAALFFPNRYESEARVFVQLQTLLPEKIGLSETARQKDVDRVKRTLTSTVNLERVIRTTDLANQLQTQTEITQAAEDLRKHIDVVEQQENLFKISARIGYRGLSDVENARLARLIVQKVIDIFVEDNLSGDRQETSQSLSFLDRQIANTEDQMRAAEARRTAFEQEVFGKIAGSGSAPARLEQARIELDRVNDDLMNAQASLAAIGGQASALGGAGSAGLNTPADQLVQLQGQLNEALGRGWTESHPDVITLRQQIARARVLVGQMPPAKRVSASAAQMVLGKERRQSISDLLMRKRDLEQDIARLTQKFAENPDFAARQESLDRDYELAKNQYASLLEKREAIRLQHSVVATTDTVSFRIIDPPSAPRGALLPDRPMILVGIGLLALVCGMAAAVTWSQAHPTFPSVEMLAQATAMPVLAAIPETPFVASQIKAQRKNRLFQMMILALLLALLLLLAIDRAQRGGLL